MKRWNPGNYVTDYIDASRDETYKLYDLSANTVKQTLLTAYPDLARTKYAKDTVVDKSIIDNSTSGLISNLMKEAAATVENSNEDKNQFIRNTSWFNPVSLFQNKINALCETDYYAYRRYRNNIQAVIDKKVELLLNDSWNKETIEKKRFLEYVNAFKSND